MALIKRGDTYWIDVTESHLWSLSVQMKTRIYAPQMISPWIQQLMKYML